MCQHDKFSVLYYDGYILVRKCVYCCEVEMCIGGAIVELYKVAHVVREVEGQKP